MTNLAPRAQESWRCLDCGVVASFESPRGRPPEGWIEREPGWLCLHCRREEVLARATAESKLEKRSDRYSERRQALTEFELLRDPGAPDSVIAKRVRSSTATVRPVRARLEEAGRLPARD